MVVLTGVGTVVTDARREARVAVAEVVVWFAEFEVGVGPVAGEMRMGGGAIAESRAGVIPLPGACVVRSAVLASTAEEQANGERGKSALLSEARVLVLSPSPSFSSFPTTRVKAR